MKYRLLLPALLAGLTLACHRRPAESVVSTTPAPEEISAVPPSGSASSSATSYKAQEPAPASRPAPPPLELWKEFSGERAMEEVKKQLDLGPRPSGTPECVKARELIVAGLKRAGWRTELQEFSDETPRGSLHFTNVIARFGKAPAGERQQAIVCSHYDTKRFSTIRFVGASDGASSTGALIELARVLALDPALAARVELVFFDGEEAVQQFTETDGLYGSRHYAQVLSESRRASQFSFGLLWDMIGDRDLTITLPSDSPAEIAKGILASAEMLGSRSHFSYFSRSMLDDHVPLNHIARVPTLDLIDFDYLPWHTADDTLDKLSPESLQTVGAVSIYYLKRTLPH